MTELATKDELETELHRLQAKECLISESLQNEAPHALTSDGQIHGARWVSGRWPNKRALLFDRDSDFVELNIPGEFQELTFSTWIKLDHINHTLNSIFNSNSWDMGDVHWNIHRNGSLSLGYKGARPTTNMSFKTLPTNQWVHLAGTLSKRSGKSCIYINGELTEIRDLETKQVINNILQKRQNSLLGISLNSSSQIGSFKVFLTMIKIKQITKHGQQKHRNSWCSLFNQIKTKASRRRLHLH